MSQPLPTLILSQGTYEVWSLWDESAEVYELFTEKECECYLGCADTRAEALEVAREWLRERLED